MRKFIIIFIALIPVCTIGQAPNDPLYKDQNSLKYINIEYAWNIEKVI